MGGWGGVWVVVVKYLLLKKTLLFTLGCYTLIFTQGGSTPDSVLLTDDPDLIKIPE